MPPPPAHRRPEPDAPATPRHVALASPTDIDGFRRLVRALIAADVDPHSVVWHVLSDEAPSLFQPQSADEVWAQGGAATTPTLRIPRWLEPVWRAAFLHRDAHRHMLIHRLLWRLQREPHLRDNALDADVVMLRDMAQSVRRDLHRMKAFVRFRHCAHLPQVLDEGLEGPRATTTGDGQSLALTLHEPAMALTTRDWLVAWYEPEHHVTEAIAPHFIKRLANEQWALLTPGASLIWQGGRLHIGPGATASDAPQPDAGEALWLTYYAHIFNPARLKPQTMQHHMPRKQWHNLPEAALISGLMDGAHERSQRMIGAPPSDASS